MDELQNLYKLVTSRPALVNKVILSIAIEYNSGKLIEEIEWRRRRAQRFRLRVKELVEKGIEAFRTQVDAKFRDMDELITRQRLAATPSGYQIFSSSLMNIRDVREVRGDVSFG